MNSMVASQTDKSYLGSYLGSALLRTHLGQNQLPYSAPEYFKQLRATVEPLRKSVSTVQGKTANFQINNLIQDLAFGDKFL